MCGAPLDVAVTPDGAFLYVTTPTFDAVSVIDTGSLAVDDIIPVGRRPSGIAISPNGLVAYVTNADSAAVSVIDTATNTVTASTPFLPASRSLQTARWRT